MRLRRDGRSLSHSSASSASLSELSSARSTSGVWRGCSGRPRSSRPESAREGGRRVWLLERDIAVDDLRPRAGEPLRGDMLDRRELDIGSDEAKPSELRLLRPRPTPSIARFSAAKLCMCSGDENGSRAS